MTDPVIITVGSQPETISVPEYIWLRDPVAHLNFPLTDIDGFKAGVGGDNLLMSGTVLGNRAYWPFSDGSTYVEQRGPDAVVVMVDSTNSPNDIVILRSVDASKLTADNFSILAAGQFPLYFDPQVASVRGGQADDVLGAGAHNEHIWGAAGSDTIFAGPGADSASGGEGNDLIVGGPGDAIRGDQGDDTLWGNPGTDFLLGGDGSDVLVANGGTDALTGGQGADRFYVSTGNIWVTDFSETEHDRIYVPAGASFSVAQYGSIALVAVSNGALIALPGVSAAGLADWISFY